MIIIPVFHCSLFSFSLVSLSFALSFIHFCACSTLLSKFCRRSKPTLTPSNQPTNQPAPVPVHDLQHTALAPSERRNTPTPITPSSDLCHAQSRSHHYVLGEQRVPWWDEFEPPSIHPSVVFGFAHELLHSNPDHPWFERGLWPCSPRATGSDTVFLFHEKSSILLQSHLCDYLRRSDLFVPFQYGPLFVYFLFGPRGRSRLPVIGWPFCPVGTRFWSI